MLIMVLLRSVFWMLVVSFLGCGPKKIIVLLEQIANDVSCNTEYRIESCSLSSITLIVVMHSRDS